jgi:hypothetical protein
VRPVGDRFRWWRIVDLLPMIVARSKAAYWLVCLDLAVNGCGVRPAGGLVPPDYYASATQDSLLSAKLV